MGSGSASTSSGTEGGTVQRWMTQQYSDQYYQSVSTPSPTYTLSYLISKCPDLIINFFFSFKRGSLCPRRGQRRGGTQCLARVSRWTTSQLRMLKCKEARRPKKRVDLGRVRGQHSVWIQVRNNPLETKNHPDFFFLILDLLKISLISEKENQMRFPGLSHMAASL